MSRILNIAKAVVITWAVSAPVLAWASQAIIYDARGSVSVAKASNARGETDSRRAIISDTVTSGMTVLTGSNSFAVLKFDDGQVVSMQANSTLLVRDFTYFPLKVSRSNIDFSLLRGGMRFITGQIGLLNPAAFKLSTPNGVIRVSGTDFYAVMTNDGLYNQVLSGTISVTNAAGVSELTAGKYALTGLPTTLPVVMASRFIPAETFSQLAAIPVPRVALAAIAEPVPVPAPKPAPEPSPVLAPAPEPVLAAAEVPAPADSLLIDSTAGGAATGGAAAAPTIAMAETTIPWSTIAIGAGVAAGLAALAGGSAASTTHH